MTTKKDRLRLAKAELLMHLSMTANRWACELNDTEPDTLPTSEWPANDTLALLWRTYRLAPNDLARLCAQLSNELEGRAERSGWDEHWDSPLAGTQ